MKKIKVLSKIGIGIVALDGMPYLPYVLRLVKQFATKIDIVEGCIDIAKYQADKNGHSTDGTFEYLKKQEDILLISNPSYVDKCFMTNLYLQELWDMDYLFMFDCDELYKLEDIPVMFNYLKRNLQIKAISVPVFHFFGDYNTIAKGNMWKYPFNRIFKIEKGCQFVSHRPPTMKYPNGDVVASREKQEPYFVKHKLYLYHYGWADPKNVTRKSEFYSRLRPNHPQYGKHKEWEEEVFKVWLKDRSFRGIPGKWGLHPADVNCESYTEEFTGEHPLKGINLNASKKIL